MQQLPSPQQRPPPQWLTLTHKPPAHCSQIEPVGQLLHPLPQPSGAPPHLSVDPGGRFVFAATSIGIVSVFAPDATAGLRQVGTSSAGALDYQGSPPSRSCRER
jgi:hypothetical protein